MGKRTTSMAERPAIPRRLFVRACGIAAVVVGSLVLAGWAANVADLESTLPGLATMKANTALAFVLAGASLLALTRAHAPAGAIFLAPASALVGLLALV